MSKSATAPADPGGGVFGPEPDRLVEVEQGPIIGTEVVVGLASGDVGVGAGDGQQPGGLGIRMAMSPPPAEVSG